METAALNTANTPETKKAGAERYTRLLSWLVLGLGSLACLFSAYDLPVERLDVRFLLIAAITISISSRITIQIPRVKGIISVSDTFVFLIMLLFGGEAAVLVAAAEALCSSLRFSKKPSTILFNSAVMACSTFLTVWVLLGYFGSIVDLPAGYPATFVTAVCIMALVQYAANSGIVALRTALKANQPIWQTWKQNFLWTSLTYIAGAAAAGGIAKLVEAVGFYAFVVATPIIAIVYFTYWTYLKNVEASVSQAEQAERHVAELSHYIAEQDRISKALQESEEHFRSAFDHAAGMALVGLDGCWRQVNRSLCEMVGYSEQELLATDFQAITHEEDLGDHLSHLDQLLKGKLLTCQMEKRYVHKLGHEVWVLVSVSLVRDAQSKPLHFIFQIQDITDRKRAEEQLHHAAYHDTLTGLPNRALFADRLKLAVGRAIRNKNYLFAVLFVDLDRFKIINDSLGHAAGDQLLISLTRRLEPCLRQVDTFARLGGDEFAILLDGIKDTNDAVRVAEWVQKQLSLPFNLDGHEVFTSASIGIALSQTGYERPDDLLRDADTAMYLAKAHGKARHEVFDKVMHARAVQTLQLETDLRRAVERGEFLIYYQPVIALETGTITGFEALVRWQHPERGIVPPGEFIPVAEETGLIIQIGQLVLRQACRQIKEWQEQFPADPPLTLSVNLSSKEFTRPDLVEEVEAILKETGLDPQCLELEITESVVMHHAESAIVMLNQLRFLGVRLSIDDFGTGYSSLSYLHRFPVNILKIDRSFVSRIGSGGENCEIVRTILTLACNLGMEVVAEGVETEEQMTQLKTLQCEYSQGFFFSKPVDAKSAKELLLNEPQWLIEATGLAAAAAADETHGRGGDQLVCDMVA